MREGKRTFGAALLLAALCVACAGAAQAQRSRAAAQAARSAEREEAEFGPVVRAYLGYLRAQQEVVDDRVSRREITRRYYVRNLNRIRSLRQMAMRIARETDNDYLPELESVASDEFGLLFDEPPRPETLRVGETLNYMFRYLGAVREGQERFYVFARLDPYEQAELRKKAETPTAAGTPAPAPTLSADPATNRPRRVNQP